MSYGLHFTNILPWFSRSVPLGPYWTIWATVDHRKNMSYSIPEEMRRGSVIGNIAKDLGLDVKRLSDRKVLSFYSFVSSAFPDKNAECRCSPDMLFTSHSPPIALLFKQMGPVCIPKPERQLE
uniref:Cadherin N-terminal domain-containing protein n=1 Tax=Paramormyrops kingsleyae TaxID=1676925 RepID=A0A3B3RGV4_9TELE